jgi:hypothetical protein
MMTDRIHSITVVLSEDMRDDDCENVIKAIGMIRGVLSAKMHVADLDSHMAYERAKADLGEKLWTVLYPKHKP